MARQDLVCAQSYKTPCSRLPKGGRYGTEPSPTATATTTASPTATATASPTATATTLPRSGGSQLVLPVTLVASLALMASGVGALVLLRRRVS